MQSQESKRENILENGFGEEYCITWGKRRESHEKKAMKKSERNENWMKGFMWGMRRTIAFACDACALPLMPVVMHW